MRIFGYQEFRQRITNLKRGTSTSMLQKQLKMGTGVLVEAMRNRIFYKGRDRNDQLISTRYSKKPMYVSKDKFVTKSAFQPIGKKGDKIKTMYLKKGYWQLKGIQGLENRKVNFKYSGKLEKDLKPSIEIISTDTGGRGLGLNAKVKIGFKTKLSKLKAEGLEKKYKLQGKVFRPSKREMRDFIDYIKTNNVN